MNKSELRETVYTPDSHLRTPSVLVREMLSDLAASRWLAWRLFVRNISAHYRQSLFGYLWAFLPPLFSMAVWVFLYSQEIISIDDPGMPYPVFVLTGIVLWQVFVDALNSPLKIMNESRPLLAKINFPREALILAGLGEVFFYFMIRGVLLVAVFAWFRVEMPGTAFLAIPGALALMTLGLMFGVLLTPLGMLYSDVGRGIGLVTQVWFFLTPVIYPMPKSGVAETLARLNPVTPILESVREWLTSGAATHLFGFWLVTGVAVVLLLFGWLFYRIAMPHLIARMSA